MGWQPIKYQNKPKARGLGGLLAGFKPKNQAEKEGAGVPRLDQEELSRPFPICAGLIDPSAGIKSNIAPNR